jgi:hypothetical protein
MTTCTEPNQTYFKPSGKFERVQIRKKLKIELILLLLSILRGSQFPSCMWRCECLARKPNYAGIAS